MAIQSINPYTGETVEEFEALSTREVEERIGKAWSAFESHRQTSWADRRQWMERAGDILDDEKEAWGRLMTEEMGKPLKAAISEAEKCAWVCRYYAEHAQQFLADEEVQTDASRSWVHYAPLGPVLAVMPWNFPFWQVFRFAAPGLMAGNVGLLKHASNVPRCALAIEKIFGRAGFADGVFQALLVESDAVNGILDDSRVRAATLTGSTGAGSAVAQRAGKRIKKTVLELGGSDPFIVMPSADLEKAIETAVKARTINNGQSCIAAKRFIVHQDVYSDFVDGFVEAMGDLKVGDPMDPETDVGPLATRSILMEVDEQTRYTVAAGAKLLLGGERSDPDSNFYPPTVLAEVPEDSPAWRDEIFGPVATVIRVSDIEQAIEVANATPFGLGSSAWTSDAAEHQRFVHGIEAGQVFINAMVASDPRLPFGGVKESGYGRELGVWGIREFVNVKTIYVGE